MTGKTEDKASKGSGSGAFLGNNKALDGRSDPCAGHQGTALREKNLLPVGAATLPVLGSSQREASPFLPWRVHKGQRAHCESNRVVLK